MLTPAPIATTRPDPSPPGCDSALRAAQARIATMFGTGPLGTILLCSDFEIFLVNDALQAMTASRPGELLGRRLHEICHPEDRFRLRRLLSDLADETIPYGQTECRLIRGDEPHLWVKLTFCTLRQKDRSHLHWLAIVEDISARRNNDSRLRRLEGAWRSLWENVADILTEISPDGRILSCNRVLDDLSPEQVIGANVCDFIVPEHRVPMREAIERASSQGELVQYEIRSLTPSGERWWLNRIAPVPGGADGDSLLLLSTDISDLKRAEQERLLAREVLEERVEDRTRELRVALEEKEVLVREIHHRVKNNLQIVSSLLRLQARRCDDASSAQILLESRLRVESMAMIHDHLYRAPQLRNIDVPAYLRSLGAQLLLAYGGDRCNVRLEIHSDDIHLSVDEAVPCGLIFNEVVTNSLKYAFPLGTPGEIQVLLACPEPGFLMLMVRDNGIGFPPGFDPFAVETLGLSLVRQLAGQLGGMYEISNSGGAAVRITFPIQQAAGGQP